MTVRIPKGSVNIGYGTGTPAGLPDYKPVNPWGRAMPKPPRPVRTLAAAHELYQVVCGDTPLGPKVHKDVAEQCALAINAQRAQGFPWPLGEAMVRKAEIKVGK